MTSLRGPLQFPKIQTANPKFTPQAIAPGIESRPAPKAEQSFLQPMTPAPLVKRGVPPVSSFRNAISRQIDSARDKAAIPTEAKPAAKSGFSSIISGKIDAAKASAAATTEAAPLAKQAVSTVQPIAPFEAAPAAKKAVQAITPVTTPTEAAPSQAAPTAAAPVEETEIAQAQTDLQLLNDSARDALTSQDDPVSKAKFNQAISRIGLVNQAQRDLLQQQINNNPDLVGQPAGTALLSMLARQQGSDVSNLITSLSLESANRIRDLNKWGFDKLAAITTFRKNEASQLRSELLQAGDFTGYAARFKEDTGIDIDVSSLKELSPATQQAIATQQDLLDAALTSGNMEKARQHFDTIAGLAPNAFKGATFEDMGFADQSYRLRSARNEDFDRQIRLDVGQGDIDDAINGIESRFTLEERQEGGLELFQDKTLEEINAALEAAGLDPIDDKTELIGQEQELFTAFKISDIVTQTGRTVVDNANDFLIDELQKTFGDILLDDTDKMLIRSFANDMVTGGEFQVDADGNVMINPNELVKPWEAGSSTEHNFKNWPVMDANGNVTDPSEFFSESNPEPDPDSATGIYYNDLNKKFDAYNLNTPKGERVSMMAWFNATQAGTNAFDIDNVPASLVPGGGGEDSLESEVERRAFNADLGALTRTDFNDRIDNDSEFFDKVVGVATNLKSTNALMDLTAKAANDEIINGKTKGIMQIGGKPFKAQEVVFTASPSGKFVVLNRLDENGEEGERVYMGIEGEYKGKIINFTSARSTLGKLKRDRDPEELLFDSANGRIFGRFQFDTKTIEEFIAGPAGVAAGSAGAGIGIGIGTDGAKDGGRGSFDPVEPFKNIIDTGVGGSSGRFG